MEDLQFRYPNPRTAQGLLRGAHDPNLDTSAWTDLRFSPRSCSGLKTKTVNDLLARPVIIAIQVDDTLPNSITHYFIS
ncbi:hypothetical protein K443DRAFT_687109 [Laccaria amethystina LaAM-08-1]|uniref:Uncharacterized protein n=1 Tax=Laccaria amethystina LaAM-08-1 TaxID=1095629 RepID=A0A0C9WZM2_9AGAR|nr:hypothetical protein K443DRAFT_687109 [Laccaria amethystina LaAM-08-1]